MENKLKALFDYQRFDGSASLAALIRETEERTSRLLTEDELSLVSAAGAFQEAKAQQEAKKFGLPEQ